MTEQAAPTPTPITRAGHGVLWFLGSLGGVFLGGVFFLAVWGHPMLPTSWRLGKVGDPEAFAEVIQIEGLDILLSPFSMSVFAIGIEALVAFFLLLNVRRLWVLVPTTLLVLFFIFLTGRAYYLSAHGETLQEVSCGCFGNLVDRTPAEAFWQDLVLLVPPLLLAYLGRPRTTEIPLLRTAVAGGLSALTVFAAASAPDLPVSDYATRLRPGVRVEAVCVGSGVERFCLGGQELAGELTEGKHLVIMADLEDDDFAEVVADRVEEFDEYVSGPNALHILVLYSGQKDLQVAFDTKSYGPPFEYQAIPLQMLRTLYRRLPRTFIVEDGVVTATFEDLPDLNALDLPPTE